MNPKTITTFVVLAAAGVVFFLMVWPKVGEVQGLRAALSDRQADALIIGNRFESTKKAIEQFNRLSKADIGLVESALPESPDLPNLYILLQSIISSAGLIGEDIQVTKDKNDDSLNISVTLHGSYESLKAYLSEAEKSLRIFDVESITFSSPEVSSIFKFGVKMKTWLY